jgi:phosphonate transport system substrate-binding protein
MRLIHHGFTILAALLLSASALAGPLFTFTAIPDEDESRLRERFDKVAAYLGTELGVETRFVPVKSYPAAVTAFRNDEVQLAWFGGLTGVQARRRVPGAMAIAQGKEDAAFVSYFIANAATGLKPAKTFPQGIAGKSFTFGAKTSTSGRLMPEFHIREQLGKTPEAAFTRVGFSGDHTKTLELVMSGAYEVGVLNYAVFRNEQQAGRVDPAKVVVLWETPPYPDYQWTARGDLDRRFGAGFTAKLKKALLTMSDPALLDSFERSGFIPAANADYHPIENTAKAIGLLDE